MAESIKVPVFSGKKEDWDVWSFRFQAFCEAHDVGNVLNPPEKAPLQRENQRKVRSWMALAMQSVVCVNMIRSVPSNTDECATAAWRKLREHFESSSAA